MIGVDCGRAGIVVPDRDPRHYEADAGQRRLDALLGGVVTRTARTPSGGRHYYFRPPVGVEVGSSVSLFVPGVDVRGRGGYVIVPPSPGVAGV